MVLANPAWTVTASSSLLLYDPAPAMSQFAWVDRTGKVLRGVGDPAPFGFTTMSPDGSRVVVTVATNAGIQVSPLWMLDTQRGVLTLFAAHNIGDNTSPVWSPDGQTVLFGTSGGLGRIAANGVGDPDVVYPFAGRLNPTDWSRRGFVLFNQFDAGTEMNIMMLPVTPDGKPVGEARPYLQSQGCKAGLTFRRMAVGWPTKNLPNPGNRKSLSTRSRSGTTRSRFPAMVDSAHAGTLRVEKCSTGLRRVG